VLPMAFTYIRVIVSRKKVAASLGEGFQTIWYRVLYSALVERRSWVSAGTGTKRPRAQPSISSDATKER
jgi:hypothetical protein